MTKSPDDEYSDGLEEQIKQLTKENTEIKRANENNVKNVLAMRSYRAELQAENARLRTALERIAAIEDRYNCGDWDEIREARTIANKALKGQP